MRELFITSLICALISLLAVVGLSVMSVGPTTKAETTRHQMTIGACLFFAAWLWLAFWVRTRWQKSPPPTWLRRTITLASLIYVAVVFFCVLG